MYQIFFGEIVFSSKRFSLDCRATKASIRQYMKLKRPCLTTFPNAEKTGKNTTRNGVFLTNLKVFWKCVRTLSFVFDISSQSRLKLSRERRNQIVKIYAIKSLRKENR